MVRINLGGEEEVLKKGINICKNTEERQNGPSWVSELFYVDI
jgi:hypothetical protein